MTKKSLRKKLGITTFAVILGTGCVLQGIPNALYPAAIAYAQDEVAEAYSKTVIDGASTWKYLDDNTDPAQGLASIHSWTEKEFDDNAWKTAAGKFGAKRGELVSFDGFTPTVLLQQYIEGTETDVPTFFFRTTFEVSNLEELTSITGTLFHDDAVAVYINGKLITSVDMPGKDQENNMFYAGSNGGSPKQLDVKMTQAQIKECLTEGENTLAVELHNDRESSSDIYFEFQNLVLNYNEENAGGDIGGEESEKPGETQKSVFLTVGSDTSTQGVTWYADTEKAGEVQYAVKNGEAFPEQYQTVKAESVASNDTGFYSNQATMTGLLEGTEYIYRVVNDDVVSEPYTFTAGDTDGSYNFAFVGDPQIGAGSTESDIEGWNQTLDVVTANLNPDFLLSAGDQVNSATDEKQYAGYVNDVFASLPSATTIGNHDSKSEAYNEHFNLPNESADKGITPAGSDYWFVYDNTLFVDINSNNRSTAEHKAFIEEAIEKNPDVKWKTVIFHHSIYSTASHVNDSDIITRREELPQVFADLDIDVVLMGHDHVYTRTYMMNGNTPDTAQKDASSVTNPEGILYLTANSASGSKYYDIEAPDAEYSAKMDQSYRRTVTDVQVTDTSYTVTTYYADDMSQLDTFTIYKTNASELQKLVDETDAMQLKESDYTKDSWKVYQTAYEAAKVVLENVDASQTEIDNAYAELKAAVEGLEKTDENLGGQTGNQMGGQTGNQTGGQTGNQTGGQTGNQSGSQSGDVQNVNSKSEPVKTGDTTNAMAAGLMMVAAASVAVVAARKKKNA